MRPVGRREFLYFPTQQKFKLGRPGGRQRVHLVPLSVRLLDSPGSRPDFPIFSETGAGL